MKRRLAAVLAADVVGYSRLIGADEAGTLAALKSLRTRTIEPLISRHRGRIVKLMGDGLLVEFHSVVDAVECAIAWQTLLAGQTNEKQLTFRIGVNIGDVVIDEDDILGDGVNVAARLESLAEPGGVCVSGAAHEQVRRHLDARFDDCGEHTVKNIAQPLRIWRWQPKAGKQGASNPQGDRKTAKPSLAVSPFRNLSEDPEQGYLADGICEDVATGLSKNSALTIVSNAGYFGDQTGASSDTTAGQPQGAQFLLEGSVRRSGRRTRVTAQLTDTGSGKRVWAERFDRELDDIFELQDEVVGSIVHALGAADGVIEGSARLRSLDVSPAAGSAYDCYLRGRHHFYKSGDSGFDKAKACYLEAIELDANFAPAYSALAWLYFVEFKLFRTKAFDQIRSKAMDLAIKALQLDRQDFRAHWVLGGIYLHDGDHAQSLAEFDKAIQINANDANLLSWSAEVLVYADRLDEAVERCEQAVKINPNCPDWYHWIKASALFHQGNYDAALGALNRMSAPGHAGKLKAAVYAYLNQPERARAEAAEFMKLVPTFSISKWARTEHYAEPAELDRYIEGQRMAGLPD